MRRNVIKEKSFDFALEIIHLYKVICHERREFVLSKQLLRAGTSIGANVRESEFAESKADFIHKLAVALKEANETGYWLELLHQTQYLPDKLFQEIFSKLEELLRLLVSIINTTKNK
ncbi:MAG TPA: four helix bundle protein [Flavobacterium sp.]|jgi:four helix bundle protein